MSTKPVKNPAKRSSPKIAPVYRQFFLDDDGRNKLHLKTTDKTIVLHLQLEAEGSRKRKIGVVTRSTKTLGIKRSRAKHLLVKGNAYGFNQHILNEAKTFDTIRLSDEFSNWKIPVSYILTEGKHLIFKQQGFELQLFLTLAQLEKYRVLKKEGRRI